MGGKVKRGELAVLVAATSLWGGGICGLPGPEFPDVNDMEPIIRNATATQEPRFAAGNYCAVESGYTSRDHPDRTSAIADPGQLKIGLHRGYLELFDQSTTYLRFEIGQEHKGLKVSEANLTLHFLGCENSLPGNYSCLEVFAISEPWNERTLNHNNAPTDSHVFRAVGLMECFPGSETTISLIDDDEDWSVIQNWIDSDQNYGIGIRAIGPAEVGSQVGCFESYELRMNREQLQPELNIKSDNQPNI
jgi:hypothetical protein